MTRYELGIDQQPQRQDSLVDQYRDLIPVAEHLGCYDAADHMKSMIRQHEAAARLLRLATSGGMYP